MNIIISNLKVAVRNLMKYKLQTLISVMSIAIGVVTLSLTYSIMTRFRLPSLFYQPYSERAYRVTFKSQDNDESVKTNADIIPTVKITEEIIRSIKHDGGPESAELITFYNGVHTGLRVRFQLPDSTEREGNVNANFIDPEYVDYIGLRSAVTGKKVKKPKAGEAIIGEQLAESIFGENNPIGAVQTLTGELQPIPVTIIDVYKEPSIYDSFYENSLCFCVTDNFEENNLNYFFASAIDIVLKEGYTPQQLLSEVNQRVSPLGLEAEIHPTLENLKSDINIICGINLTVYIIGSLILLAALIGFLRIQVQLFWLRRREISLRIVNGAGQMQIFCLLLTEIAIIILLSILAAIILGSLLQDFFNNNSFFANSDIPVRNLGYYSSVTGGILLVVCSLIAWVTQRRIHNSSQGLAAFMRTGRNHLFRNIMLGIQTTISIIFVCSTFILINGGKLILEKCNIPENDSFYKQCLFLRPEYCAQSRQLIDEISRLPELDRAIMSAGIYLQVAEVANNPEIAEKFYGETYYNFYITNDTAMVSFLGMDVEWFNNDADRSQCVLIREDLYNQFLELGIIDSNTITIVLNSININQSLPIAGIIKNIPYDFEKIHKHKMVAIFPAAKEISNEYVLVPKPGKEKELARSVNETIGRVAPEIINPMVFGFRDIINPMPTITEFVTTGGVILGLVSLIITAMSIFSSIALDTRARKKEVAIRKVNGAKSKDIYLMFGRVYGIIIAISLLIAIPVCVLFNGLIKTIFHEIIPPSEASPAGPVIAGVTIVILLIILIVWLQIRKTMRTDPAEIISKE